MSGKTIGIVVLVLIVIGALAWYFSSSPSMSATTPVSTTTASTTTTTTTVNGATVEYTGNAFSPATVAIQQGQTVTWVNDSSQNLWVASDPHPIHNGYDGTTLSQHCAAGYTGPAPFDECTMLAPGSSWSFTFDKIGTWGYHNHADASVRGTVIVAAPAATSTTSTTVNVNVTQ